MREVKGLKSKFLFITMIPLGIYYLGFFNIKSYASIAVSQPVNLLPILSGPVAEFLWDNDETFLKAKRENNADRLIAGYKTVLLDPLPGEEYNVHLCAKLLCGTIVKGGSVFSMNKKLGPYTTSRGFKDGPTYAGKRLITTTGGGICKIATTLYNATVLSNLPVEERHYHSMPVSYVLYGQDATVAYGSRDFKFKNSNASPILIWAQGVDDTLYIGFYGDYTPPKVEWNHETLDIIKTTTIYKKNKKLPPGTEKVAVVGMDGKIVKSSVNITYSDGRVETKNMGISRYKPLPHIVEIGGK